MLGYESKAFSTQKRNAHVKMDIFDLELLSVNRLHIVSKLQYNLRSLHLSLKFSMIGISLCILLHIRVLASFPEPSLEI